MTGFPAREAKSLSKPIRRLLPAATMIALIIPEKGLLLFAATCCAGGLFAWRNPAGRVLFRSACSWQLAPHFSTDRTSLCATGSPLHREFNDTAGLRFGSCASVFDALADEPPKFALGQRLGQV